MTTTTNVARRQVWKYSLPPDSIHTEANIKLPATHKIVHVGYDPKDGSVALWIEVPVISDDPDASLNGANAAATELWSKATDEAFRVVATGQDLPADLSDSGRQSDNPATPLYRCSLPPPYDHKPEHAPCPRCVPIATPEAVGISVGGWAHIGTAIDINFGWVWHVYQRKLNGA